jgi:hypothetical protein
MVWSACTAYIDTQMRYICIMTCTYSGGQGQRECYSNIMNANGVQTSCNHTHELHASDLGWDDVEHQSIRGVRRWILNGYHRAVRHSQKTQHTEGKEAISLYFTKQVER